MTTRTPPISLSDSSSFESSLLDNSLANSSLSSSALSASWLERAFTVASFNIQAGARADRYHDYVTKAWQHVLSGPSKADNLTAIANAIAEFDLVCLQEADGGSTRSAFVHQAHRIANLANFGTVLDQRNRKVGLKNLPFSSSGNAVLARQGCNDWKEHPLPGTVKGRGVIAAGFVGVRVFNLHLSLTANAQRMQLDYIAEQISLLPKTEPVIVTGDFNATPNAPAVRAFIESLKLELAPTNATFPSWAPTRQIDLILYRGLKLMRSWTMPVLASDHLGVAAEFVGLRDK